MPPELSLEVGVGAIVKIPLGGRRVRGWVLEDYVESETEVSRLRPLLSVASAGPTLELLSLAQWAAWRWAGPLTTFLRAGSPANYVLGNRVATGQILHNPTLSAIALAALESSHAISTQFMDHMIDLRLWPPCLDRRPLLSEVISPTGSSIIIVPDARSARVVGTALGRQGREVVLMRSSLDAATRTSAWLRARAGECIVVGSRIAAWAPVPDLEAVAIFDEGDDSLQSEKAPTWHARELLVERALRLNAKVTMISPVPSPQVAAMVPAPVRQSRSQEQEGWPAVEVIDRRGEPPGLGLWSPRLVEVMREVLSENGIVACILNRRGRAVLMACGNCGNLLACESCGAAMAEVAKSSASVGIECRRCATWAPRSCTGCGSANIKTLRVGASRAAQEAQALFPRVRVEVIEGPDSSHANLQGSESHGTPIIYVGTQAALHRLSSARMVAFLEIDQELLAPRYRAGEQALWLLVRAARLVGTRSGGGRVLVQTRMGDHEVLGAAVNANPMPWLKAEAARRGALDLPPSGALAELSGDHDSVDVACTGIGNFALIHAASGDLTGESELPASDLPVVKTPAGKLLVSGPIADSKGSRALVRATSIELLCSALRHGVGDARSHGRLRVAVDPPDV